MDALDNIGQDFQMPSVLNVITKPDKNFTLKVYAYRKLSADELRWVLGFWLNRANLPEIPRNQTVELPTTIGAFD